MAHIADYKIDKQYNATVKNTKRFTPNNKEEVREIVLELDKNGFDCKIDQSFGVLVDTNGEFGKNTHHRLYSVADIPKSSKSKIQLTMLVKRCSYVDDFNGELYEGVASNYLCDRKKGDKVKITGPYELPFKIPEDKNSNLILIGIGTGIAPFRAFIKHLFKNKKDWKGKILLFYGAKSGLELLYLNEKDGDLTNYYDDETFKAFHALSERPHWNDPILLDLEIEKRAKEILELLKFSNTYIYVAGYEKVKDNLDKAFAKIMGSKEKWMERKAELQAGKKWAEIVY